MKYKDRIRSLRRVKASDLLPNPKNRRTHPDSQANALRGVLAEVGFADAVLARETDDGLMLIDGHLRAEVAPDAKLPVLVLDVTEDEADKILASHDPLAAMAGANTELLSELLDGMEFDSDAAQAMLDELASEHGVLADETPPIVEDEAPEPPEDPVSKPGDMWQLGRHRLVCGDSTNSSDVAKALDGSTPFIMVTDPPYGIEYDPAWRNEAAGLRQLQTIHVRACRLQDVPAQRLAEVGQPLAEDGRLGGVLLGSAIGRLPRRHLPHGSG